MPQILRSNFAFPARQGGESLDLDFEVDASSGLPLLSESADILKLVLTYLALPYSIVEYGCGKKTSLILRLLFEHGLPVQALTRGMIIERDLSQKTLEDTDPSRRPHALTAFNPLSKRVDLHNSVLRQLLQEVGITVDCEAGELQAGDYVLQHRESIQFVQARSHVFPCVTFWDEARHKAVVRIVDPTLDSSRLLPVNALRNLLGGGEAFILSATMLGRFFLNPHYLTDSQKRAVTEALPREHGLADLSWEDQAELLRKLLGAAASSIGDPATWTYANNMAVPDPAHHQLQVRQTGSGDLLREPIKEILEARQAHDEHRLEGALEVLDHYVRQLDLRDVLGVDARWSEAELHPLATLAKTVSYHLSLASLADRLSAGHDPVDAVNDEETQRKLHGLGVRLRGRIEDLAWHSSAPDTGIDARAINAHFVNAACETIRQMNRAGLSVFVDKVGNIHGLQLSDGERESLASGETSLSEFTRGAICHGSHIDTVLDAGKFDGRLGVLSGIEIAHTLHDLRRFYGHSSDRGASGRRILVSAFIGEEMTYTGENISMPGSSGVAGLTTPEAVHAMVDSEGGRFRDGLVKMLQALGDHAKRGDLHLAQNLDCEESRTLISNCPDPTDFYTPHLVERHIEQGLRLDRCGIPLIVTDHVMGLSQEDFRVTGSQAEAAGLSFIRSLRLLNQEARFRELRVTSGIFQPELARARYLCPTFALRWRLTGTVDHAGAASRTDRHDAGIAAALLAHQFFEIFESSHAEAHPVLGSVRFHPGKNRNVIPGMVELTLAIEGPYPEEEQTGLLQQLHAYAVSVLTDKVPAGGAGCSFCGVQSASFVNVATETLLAIDIRGEEDETVRAFQNEMSAAWRRSLDQFDANGDRLHRQGCQSIDLSRTGQVLQLERSYGGSHNPREAELPEDLLTGTLLQLAATWDFLNSEDSARTVRDITLARIPKSWKGPTNFTSGALHDSCNFAAVATRTSDPEKGSTS